MTTPYFDIDTLRALCLLFSFCNSPSFGLPLESVLLCADVDNAPQQLTEGEENMLCQVIVDGDAKQLVQLIALGASVNARFKDGRTPLMVAAASGQLEDIKLLLKKGAHLKARDHQGRTALMACIEHTRTEGYFYDHIISFLLAHGEDVNAHDNEGNTPLLLLLDTDLVFSDVVDARDPHDSLVSTVKLLLSKGAKVNVKNKRGKTALMLATEAHPISSHGPETPIPQTTLNDPVIAPQYAEVAWLLRKAGAKE